jgi:hypothetical protein
MLLLEGYISNFTRARYYFLCVEFSDFYVNQSLTGQTIQQFVHIVRLLYVNLNVRGDSFSKFMTEGIKTTD